MNRYYIKNYYTLGTLIDFSGFFNVSYNDFDCDIELPLNNNGIDLKIFLDNSLPFDGYTISIKKEVIIKAFNKRALNYAINLLKQLISNNTLPYSFIEDHPNFKYRGIIEGFYGIPWSHENRLDVIRFLDKYQMNMYVYAPKDDLYHRELWREFYPEKELNQLLSLNKLASEKEIEFCYAISPGKDFVFTNENDYLALFNKIDFLFNHGITMFSLLLDDIDYNLKEADEKIFTSPGKAHAHLSNRLYEHLLTLTDEPYLVICPTEYSTIDDSLYHQDLRSDLNKNIIVYFTGINVCANAITNQDIKMISKVYGHDIAIWDNYPVNDYIPQRLYLSPIYNRGNELNTQVVQYVCNPMNQWESSKFALISLARYLWNSSKYDPDLALEEGLDLYPDIKESLSVFIRANYPNISTYGENLAFKDQIKNHNFKEIIKFYQELIDAIENLKNYNYPLIKEISPWFKRAEVEYNIVCKYLSNTLTKEDILNLKNDSHTYGIEIVDYIIKESNLLTESEFTNYIFKVRGYGWWNSFEK